MENQDGGRLPFWILKIAIISVLINIFTSFLFDCSKFYYHIFWSTSEISRFKMAAISHLQHTIAIHSVLLNILTYFFFYSRLSDTFSAHHMKYQDPKWLPTAILNWKKHLINFSVNLLQPRREGEASRTHFAAIRISRTVSLVISSQPFPLDDLSSNS